MDRSKSRKNVKVESGGNGMETGESLPLPRKTSKKKHSKKSDGEFNSGHFSFRYLFCNSPFYPQRFRCRNRARLTGTSTTSANEAGRSTVIDDKDAPTHSVKSSANIRSSNDEKPGRDEDCKIRECPLCLTDLPIEFFPKLISCQHRSCIDCYQQYLRIEISESRVNVTCPECPENLHPNDIRLMLNDSVLFEKYEDFTLRRLLSVDPDTRWCPAPDCGYAVVASGCASCPKLRCEKPGCGSYFCYHCKAAWHPNQTCDSARAERSTNLRSSTFSRDSQTREDIKCCPICRVLIVKMDDGSCNHMTCAVCGAEFCWLCMNVVGDLHYLSPSGCTFWGKKPWSRKKKILWQLGILVGAPVGIALIAGIAVPAIIIGVPIWTGRKMYTKFLFAKKCRRNAAIVTGVITAMILSPIFAALAVSIGIPILLFYVYGVVPVSLCRSSGCGVRASTNGVRLDFDEPEYMVNQGALANKANSGSQGLSIDADMVSQVSHKEANPSIGEASLSLGSGTHLEHLGREQDRDSSSTIALAGSIFARRFELLSEVFAAQNASGNNGSETASDRSDIATSSTRALHGSLLNYKTDALSTHSYKLVGNEGGSTSVDQRSEANLSLSSFDELTASLVQRVRSLKQTSESSDDGMKLDDAISVNFKSEMAAEPVEPVPPSKPSPSRNLLRNLFFNLTASPTGQTSKSRVPSASSSWARKKSGTHVDGKVSSSTSLPSAVGSSRKNASGKSHKSSKDGSGI